MSSVHSVVQGVSHENPGMRVSGANLALGWGSSGLSAFMLWKGLKRTFFTACRALVEAPKFQPLLSSAKKSWVLPKVTASHSEVAACLRRGRGNPSYGIKAVLSSFGTLLTSVGCPHLLSNP